MARIYITNSSDRKAKFGRGQGTFTMEPGVTDYWVIDGPKIYLLEPNESNGFQAQEDDKYMVFKDQDGLYRFAYMGKDGYVASLKDQA